MSNALARVLAASAAGAPLTVYPGYCQSITPGAVAVQITGELVLTGLEYVGAPGSLAVGRVLLLDTPGAPVILGNLNT
jgi:hypothetical protein